MTPAPSPLLSPRLQVIALEATIQSRGVGSLVYLMPDELAVLLEFAHEGAASVERRATLTDVLEKIQACGPKRSPRRRADRA